MGAPLQQLELSGWLDQVATEGDVEVPALPINGVIAVTLEHAHPDGVTGSQWQQQALGLHDAALAGLCIQHGCGLPIAHDVQVGLLVIPGMHGEAQEVHTGHSTEEVAGGQVEGTIQVHQLRVEWHGLEGISAVQPLAPAHRECSVGALAWSAWWPHLSLLALAALEAPEAWWALLSAPTRATSDPCLSLLTCRGASRSLWSRLGIYLLAT